MANITKEDVLDRLRSVTAPNGGDIVSAGIVSDIFVTGGKVMTQPGPQCHGVVDGAQLSRTRALIHAGAPGPAPGGSARRAWME